MVCSLLSKCLAQSHGNIVTMLALLHWHRELVNEICKYNALIFRIMFIDSIAMTAMTFILERKEGLFERSYAAGKETL